MHAQSIKCLFTIIFQCAMHALVRIHCLFRHELSMSGEMNFQLNLKQALPVDQQLYFFSHCTHTNKQLNLLHQQINIFGNYFVRATNPYGKTY